MFRAKGAREKELSERMQGGEAFGVTQFVLEKVSAEKPKDGISRLSGLKKRNLHLIEESELIRGMG